LIADDLLGEVEGKAIGIVELEEFLARDELPPTLARLLGDSGEQAHPRL
jgi:hypothetical protein